jgi:hypothetical protein
MQSLDDWFALAIRMSTAHFMKTSHAQRPICSLTVAASTRDASLMDGGLGSRFMSSETRLVDAARMYRPPWVREPPRSDGKRVEARAWGTSINAT